MSLILPFVVAMAVTMALVPLLVRWAGTVGLVDAPGERKVHAAPMPRVGGVAMVAGVLAALLMWMPPHDPRTLAYLGGAAIIVVFGVWDDRKDLAPMVKLGGQLLAILFVVVVGGVQIDTYTLTERHAIPAFIGLPVTLVFLLGVTNAINLSDGLDGLAGGTTLLTASALFLLAHLCGDVAVALVALSVVGALLGFLRFNTFPARIFMGDCGSQFLGFTVAVLAVMLTQREGQAFSTAMPLMLLGLPVVDTLMVMAQRLREGRSPFSADKHHLHHKLLGLGFDHHEAVAAIYAVQGLFFLGGWLLRFEPDLAILLVFVLMSLGVVGMLLAAGRLGWRWRQPAVQGRGRGRMVERAAPLSPLRRFSIWAAQPQHLPCWALRASVALVLAYVLGGALLKQPALRDVAVLAAALAAVLWGSLLLRARSAVALPGWASRSAFYTAAALAVYQDHITFNDSELFQWIKLLGLPLLALAVVVRMRLSRERRFELTTLDVLLLFIALVVPNLPGLTTGTGNLGLSVLKLVALVYAIELCSDQSVRGERWLAAGVALSVTVVAVRGWG
jgi:UDP-GlcNAc:undecaprenyl-phosphate GlcNAc-1-phosphate transferase